MGATNMRGIAAGALTAGSVAGLVLIERLLVRSGPPADSAVTVPAALALAGAAAVGAGWPRIRPRLGLVGAAVAGVLLIGALLHRPHVVPREAFWILAGEAVLLLILSLTVRWATWREAVLVAALATAAGTLTMLRVTDPSSTLEAVGVVCTWGVVAAGPAALGLYLRALDDRRSRMVLEARRAQRLELAYDLHDFVAHDVTGMVVQAQAALAVAARNPEEAISALRRIEESGLHALGSLDRTVHTLRDVASSAGEVHSASSVHMETESDAKVLGIEDIFHLVGRFSSTDHLPVRLQVDSVRGVQVAPEVSATAYRVVREALTNVRRHAPRSTAVEVRVFRSLGAGTPTMVVSITNTVPEHDEPGRGFGGSRPHGLGLPGLAERVEGIGGSLVAGPLDAGRSPGWQVTAVLPLRETARR